MRKPIIIKEGDNLRLRCSASGYPEPKSKNPLSIFNRDLGILFCYFSSMEARRRTDDKLW